MAPDVPPLVSIHLQLKQFLLLKVRGVLPFKQILPYKHIVQSCNKTHPVMKYLSVKIRPAMV